jgi:pyrroline-5-carboxylate reductase
MHVLMVGCGNMGASLLARWVDVPGMTYSVADPVATFPDSRVKSFKSAEDVEGGPFDLLVIAVKPQLIAGVIPDYLDQIKADAPALSIAAGVSCERLESIVGARPVIRVMPNLPASIGKGVSGLYFTDKTPDGAKETGAQMMKAAGTIVVVDEEFDLDKVTAIAGSGPGLCLRDRAGLHGSGQGAWLRKRAGPQTGARHHCRNDRDGRRLNR